MLEELQKGYKKRKKVGNSKEGNASLQSKLMDFNSRLRTAIPDSEDARKSKEDVKKDKKDDKKNKKDKKDKKEKKDKDGNKAEEMEGTFAEIWDAAEGSDDDDWL